MAIRWALRQDTAAAHAAIEQLYETLDLSSRPGLTVFLAAHAAAFRAIVGALDATVPAELADRVAAMIALIEADLATLDVTRHPQGLPAPSPVADPLGLVYVVAGSRLGARILARRAAASPDPAVRGACGYLAAAQSDGLWPAFVAHLEDRALPPRDQARVIAGAHAGFACFESAYHLAKDCYGNVGLAECV